MFGEVTMQFNFLEICVCTQTGVALALEEPLWGMGNHQSRDVTAQSAKNEGLLRVQP